MDNLSYIAFICLVVSLGLMLPLMEANTTVYSKKSANTFVGDEKYQAVRAEVEAAAAAFGDVDIQETVTLRDKSDGTQSSMVTFSAVTRKGVNAAALLRSGLPAGKLPALLLWH